MGEDWADRYKLPDEIRGRTDGSERLAIALVVLSRANAANVNNPLRFCLEELVESVDWRCLGRFKVSLDVDAARAILSGDDGVCSGDGSGEPRDCDCCC